MGLDIKDVEFLGVVNNVFSFQEHYVNIDFVAKGVSGNSKICEPDKCPEIDRYSLTNLPQPLMLLTTNLFKTHPKILEKLKNFNSFEY